MKIDKESQEFIESMGMIFQDDGHPRIAGRILGFLMIYTDPFSLQDLADHLEVSRGSISTNTRVLERFGMVERVARSGDRQGFYQLAANSYPNMVQGAIQRMTKAKLVVDKAAARIPKGSTRARKNLADMARFYEVTITGLGKIIRDYSGS